MEHKRNGDAKVDSEAIEEIDEEQEVKERNTALRLISYFSNRGSVRVEFSCFDENQRVNVFIDLTGEVEIYFEYENVKDSYWVKISMTKLKGHATL